MKDLLRRALVVLAFALGLLVAPSLHAQSAPPGALAWTECLGGHVNTYVNAKIIGSDSLQEILVHEAKHREQAQRVAPGTCPVVDTPWKLLRDEVEAYCASKPIRMQRYSEQEVDENYVARMLLQFEGAMPRFDVARAYHDACSTEEIGTLLAGAVKEIKQASDQPSGSQ